MLVAYGIWWSFSMFYVQILKEFGWSRGNTATIFTVGSVVYGFGSLVAGALVDRFGPRKLLPLACLLIAIGCLINFSGARQLWHFYVAYGVFIGLGVICAGFVPMTVVLSNWFVRRRGAALGVALIGNIQPPSAGGSHSIFDCHLRMAVILRHFGGYRSFDHRAFDGSADADPSPRRRSGAGRTSGQGESSGRAVRDASRVYRRDRQSGMGGNGLDPGPGDPDPPVLDSVRHDGGHGDRGRHDHASSCGHGDGRRAHGRAGGLHLQPGGPCSIGGRLGGFLSDRWGREAVFTILAVFLYPERSVPAGDDPQRAGLASLSLRPGLRAWGRFELPAFGAGTADLFIGRSFGAILGFINISYGIGQGVGAWAGGAIFDKTGSYSLAMLAAIPLFAAMCLLFWLAGPRKIRKMVKTSSPIEGED